MKKTLTNTTASQAKDNVRDIVFWGDGDTFKLISKASSLNEGWMKSTKAMEIPGVGCVVQVTTQQRNENGTYAIAEAVTFVPGVCIKQNMFEDKCVSRELVAIKNQ
jgi:endonuclease YncB( thermonuclease family)